MPPQHNCAKATKVTRNKKGIYYKIMSKIFLRLKTKKQDFQIAIGPVCDSTVNYKKVLSAHRKYTDLFYTFQCRISRQIFGNFRLVYVL